MKAKYKIIFVLFFMGTVSYAQVLVGPIAGGNYSFTSFGDKDLKDIYKVSGVFGYHVGAHTSFQVRKRFFLQASLIYSTKGRQMRSNLDPGFRYQAKFNFIEFPLIYTVDFKAKLKDSKEFKYFIGIGANTSYWLGGSGTLADSWLKEGNVDKMKFRTDFKGDSQNDNSMYVERRNKVQFGLNFVAGLVFEPAPRQRLLFSLRYELGHTYLAKSDGVFSKTYFQDPLQSTNQGFRISVAYLYDLKTSDRNKGKSTIDKKHPK